ncbi:MAG: T9SS type A sorting domain-containing protein [Candidatus Kapabacteria bacterium]|jgi:hypothetical protein|nr:T9SS type A sorting domain-containing protein [Candidatus Kapabacteria bacterium]
MRYSALILVLAVLGFVRLSAQSTTTATILRPYITETSPRSLVTGVDSTILTIRGGRFQIGATVLLNGRNLRTLRQEGDSVLAVVIGGELLLWADIATLQVENPDFTKVGWRIGIADGCGGSVWGIFNRLSPQTAIALSQSITITLEVQPPQEIKPDARLFYNGSPLRIVRIAPPRSITAEIPPSLTTTSGSFALQVVQPRGCQIVVPFELTPPIDTSLAPKITRINPIYFPPPNNTIHIFGINFSANAVVRLGPYFGTVIRATSNLLSVLLPRNLPIGFFALSVTNPDGQSVTTPWPLAILGINTNSANTTLSPNPAQTTLTFSTTLDRASNLTLTLRNTLGASVLAEQHTAAAGRFSTALDISTLASGVYLLEARYDAGSQWVQKVVKY